jgi:hypothetical protein
MKAVLCIVSCSILFADTAHAEGASQAAQASALVEQQLVNPLRQQDEMRSRFSRARRPPEEWRARVLDSDALRDPSSARFHRFTVQIRSGDDWRDYLSGCAYVKQVAVYVQHGDGYVSAAAQVAGKPDKPPASVCRYGPSSV